MAEQMRPASKEQAPDPSSSYERSHPDREAGMGRLDNNDSTPMRQDDKMEQAVKNRQDPRQINAHDVVNQRTTADASSNQMPPPAPVDHSMKDEEPLGSDQAPNDIKNPRDQRHPRTGGKGGTPDENAPRRNG